MEDRQHTTKECADKLIPEIICFRKKFDQVYQYDCDGKPIIQLPKDSPVRSALGEIVKKLGL